MQPLGNTVANASISLGLLNAPVKMYKATRTSDVSFKMCSPDGSPVEQVYRVVGTGEVVGTNADCGREFNGKLISKDDLTKINDEAVKENGHDLKKALNVDAFIPLKSVPFQRVTDWYYVAPDPKASKDSFAILTKAMEKKKVAAVCKWIPRSRQTMLVLYVENGLMYAVTVSFASDVCEPPKVEDLPKPDAKFVEAAENLIDAFRDDEADVLASMEDTAVAKRLALIEAATEGKAIEVTAAAETKPGPDLMAALEESIKLAKKSKGKKVAA